MRFFGREQEITDMLALWGKRTGSLVTCRGRRRIGKSTLIEKFAEKSDAFFIKIRIVRYMNAEINGTVFVTARAMLKPELKSLPNIN